MKNTSLLITIVVAVVVGAAGFFIGMQYQKSQTRTAFANFQGENGMMRGQNGQRNGQGFRGRNGMGNGAIGEVVNIDANSVTVKLPDGSSKIVNLSNSTTYSTTANGSKSDIKAGQRIAAFGTTNSDGSITAQNIQINPQFAGRGPGGTSPSPSVTK
jgi:uncharacterized protein (UPF0333 family)